MIITHLGTRTKSYTSGRMDTGLINLGNRLDIRKYLIAILIITAP